MDQVPCTWYLVPGTSHQVPDTRHMVQGSWYLVSGTRATTIVVALMCTKGMSEENIGNMAIRPAEAG